MFNVYLSNFDTWYSRFECDKETTRLVDLPSDPRSYNSIELFSDKVYSMCRVLSMVISIIAEGSVIAYDKNDGKMNDRVPAE